MVLRHEDTHRCGWHPRPYPQRLTTAANVNDIVPAGNFLHGDERRVFGDAGYPGIQKRDEHKDRKNVFWFIAKRPGSRRNMDARKLKAEKLKASARAKVKHPVWYIKQVFDYSKVRYRGLAKNSNRLHLLAVCSNLLMVEKYLLAYGQCTWILPEGGKRAENEQTEGEITSKSSFNGFFD